MKRYLAALFIILSGCVQAAQHGPHVHGAAELQVAVEKDTLAIELRSPLDNVLGFEQTPKTDAQRAAVKSMIDKLNRPAALFKLPPAASCAAGPVQTDYRFNEPPAKSGMAGTKATDKDRGDHADLMARFSFTCASPDKLDAMELLIFSVFPGMKSIKAQIVGPRGQSAATLTPSRRTIKF